ncbi:MAG: GGDEF domain-containing protein, partial [Burkholderiales bacterium]
ESVVRKSDTVSRHGGDEFLVLLADVLQAADARMIAAKMLSALSEPCIVRAQTLRLTASIGIALYPDDGADAETIVGHADDAMYRVKRRGGNGLEHHHEAAATDPFHRLLIVQRPRLPTLKP